jgi:hypothetical protein
MSFYNNNTAVIKATFLRMNKENFIIHAKEIKSIFLSLDYEDENLNLRYKFKNLYDWCGAFYRKKYIH